MGVNTELSSTKKRGGKILNRQRSKSHARGQEKGNSHREVNLSAKWLAGLISHKRSENRKKIRSGGRTETLSGNALTYGRLRFQRRSRFNHHAREIKQRERKKGKGEQP